MASVTITRTFSAPRDKVWQAWTSPEHAKQWWGPKDFTAPVIKIDLKEGGTYHFCMRGKAGPDMPEGDFWSTGTYKEVVPMEKLVFTDSFSNEKGDVIPGAEYGMPDMPLEMLVTVIFEDAGDGKTLMTLTHEGLPEGTHGEMTKVGWGQSFDKMAASF